MFGPIVILYKATALSEYNSKYICAYGSIAYLLTQSVKVILYAFSLPIVPEHSSIAYPDFYLSLSKSLLSSIDLLGIYILLNQRIGVGSSHLRLLGVSLGWSATESIVTRLIPIWISTRSIEFSWDPLILSLESNARILYNLSIIIHMWCWSTIVRFIIPPITTTNTSSSTSPPTKKIIMVLIGMMAYVFAPMFIFQSEATKSSSLIQSMVYCTILYTWSRYNHDEVKNGPGGGGGVKRVKSSKKRGWWEIPHWDNPQIWLVRSFSMINTAQSLFVYRCYTHGHTGDVTGMSR